MAQKFRTVRYTLLGAKKKGCGVLNQAPWSWQRNWVGGRAASRQWRATEEAFVSLSTHFFQWW